MKYQFTCPLEGCGQIISANAVTDEAGASVLTEIAKGHLVVVHPELQKTDEQVTADVRTLMKKEEATTPQTD